MAFAEIAAILLDVLQHDLPCARSRLALNKCRRALSDRPPDRQRDQRTRQPSARRGSARVAGYAGSARRYSSGDALGFVAFVVSVLWAFSHTNIGWD